MKYPPGISRRRNLRAALERRDQHVKRRHQREDRKQREEKVRPLQRPSAVAADAAIFDRAGRRGLVDHDSACHQASFPRLLISRRMKTAAIASIGNMNSETLAPSGMSPPSIPTRNAQVAKICVWSSGPPVVRMRTISKLANVTMSENSVVIAMMLRIIGSVTYQMRCHQLAPSMAAALSSFSGTDFSDARYMIIKKGAPYQTLTRMTEKRAQVASPVQGIGPMPKNE